MSTSTSPKITNTSQNNEDYHYYKDDILRYVSFLNFLTKIFLLLYNVFMLIIIFVELFLKIIWKFIYFLEILLVNTFSFADHVFIQNKDLTHTDMINMIFQ